MSLDFVQKKEDRPSQGVRLDPDSIEVLQEYKELLGLPGKNTALNSILKLVKKIGVENFLKMANGSGTMNFDSTDNSGKIVNVGTNHGTINDKALKKKRKNP